MKTLESVIMRSLYSNHKQQVSSLAEDSRNNSVAHESAKKHVTGKALFIDDQIEYQDQLHAAVGKSPIAYAKIKKLDLSQVYAAEGVKAVVSAENVPGECEIGAVYSGDLVLAKDIVEFVGQPLFAVAATSFELACRAAKLAIIEFQELEPVLSVSKALQDRHFVRPSKVMARGNAHRAIQLAENHIEGELNIGGQEHFYLEGQVSSALPTENGGMMIFSSTQHPAMVQKMVAKVLAVPLNLIDVEVSRMGGAFGGKETQAAQWACIAALLAHKTQQPVKLCLSRHDDFVMTGKRHPFSNHYRVGFDNDGCIRGVEIIVNANCGHSPDLSDSIVDRAMLHVDNAYYLENVRVEGNLCKTNTVSNTAFRGFGGPQGMITIECIMDDIARHLHKDPLEVRKSNFYSLKNNSTHYHQKVENNFLPEIVSCLEHNSNYLKRSNEINEFNATNSILKKGLALTPVKFGISFTQQHLNQAGALIHIYIDGSIHLNHGGTEMGQGLFTKVAQVVAEEFQVPIAIIHNSATRTDKVPNTSPTAASSSTDLNGKAAQNAARTLKNRLTEFASEHFSVHVNEISFTNGGIAVGLSNLSFVELVQLAYMQRISLSATGYYRTPKIHYDHDKACGRPYFYYAFGAAVSEVIIDTLSGEYKVLRVDILHDVGNSINPAIDMGQIEGGFIQGMGWLTTEDLQWNDEGRLLSDGPDTYKIPGIGDMPLDFNIELTTGTPNQEDTVHRSKAVGEPPFMLAISIWSALRDAISSLSNYRISPQLDTPATPERVLSAINVIQKGAQ